jgi:hypothetical protein
MGEDAEMDEGVGIPIEIISIINCETKAYLESNSSHKNLSKFNKLDFKQLRRSYN